MISRPRTGLFLRSSVHLMQTTSAYEASNSLMMVPVATPFFTVISTMLRALPVSSSILVQRPAMSYVCTKAIMCSAGSRKGPSLEHGGHGFWDTSVGRSR